MTGIVDVMTDTAAVACSRCGQGLRAGESPQPGSGANPEPPADAAAVAAGWSHEAGDGDIASWVCPACVRRHIRSIEARLDEAWW